MRHAKTERNNQVYRDKLAGMRSRALDAKYGVCEHRIWQILKRMRYNFYAIESEGE